MRVWWAVVWFTALLQWWVHNLSWPLNIHHAAFATFFTAIDCGDLSQPSNGQISIPVTTLGSMATYSCDPGYTLDGNASRICGSDGQWSGSQPSCSGEWSLLTVKHTPCCICNIFLTAVDCGDLSQPSNGQISIPATTLGSMATYSCDPGYTLDGNASRICGSDGQWSGSQPSCSGEWSLLTVKHTPCCICNIFLTAVDCGDLSQPSNGQISIPATTLGSMATYSCDPGYTLDGNASRICGSDGQWSGSQPSCSGEWSLLTVKHKLLSPCCICVIAIDCGSLSAPSNGQISITTTTFGSMTTYSCDPGYILDGNSSRICLSDGQWSGSQPSCSGECVQLVKNIMPLK